MQMEKTFKKAGVKIKFGENTEGTPFLIADMNIDIADLLSEKDIEKQIQFLRLQIYILELQLSLIKACREATSQIPPK